MALTLLLKIKIMKVFGAEEKNVRHMETVQLVMNTVVRMSPLQKKFRESTALQNILKL